MDRLLSLDLFDVDALLSDAERAARRSVARFVDHEVLPVIDGHFRAGTFPAGLFRRLGELGLLGATLTDWGGAGLSHTGYGMCLLELERGDSGLRSAASVQGSLVIFPIEAFGSAEQKARWLPALVRGEAVGAFALTEPDHGSDPATLETRALPGKDGGYVLRGAKRWVTNAALADVLVVWARVGDGPQGIRGFLVERGAPGLRVREMEGKWSLRASSTGEVFLDDVDVPASALLPGTRGIGSALKCLNSARAGIAFGAVGSALATLECARRYTVERQQFGRPLGGFQLVQEKLVDSFQETQAALLMAYHLGRHKDAGTATHAHVSLCKRHNVEVARRCAHRARDLLGANGITDAYPVMRHLLNLETVSTYEGTHDVHTLILGRELTGQDAFA